MRCAAPGAQGREWEEVMVQACVRVWCGPRRLPAASHIARARPASRFPRRRLPGRRLCRCPAAAAAVALLPARRRSVAQPPQQLLHAVRNQHPRDDADRCARRRHELAAPEAPHLGQACGCVTGGCERVEATGSRARAEGEPVRPTCVRSCWLSARVETSSVLSPSTFLRYAFW